MARPTNDPMDLKAYPAHDKTFLYVILFSLISLSAIIAGNIITSHNGSSISMELTSRLAAAGVPLHPAKFWEPSNE